MGSWCYGLVEIYNKEYEDKELVLCEIFWVNDKATAINPIDNKELLKDKKLINQDITAQLANSYTFVWKNNKLTMKKPKVKK
jgi:hypothetical protein